MGVDVVLASNPYAVDAVTKATTTPSVPVAGRDEIARALADATGGGAGAPFATQFSYPPALLLRADRVIQ
jgi:hypothetical protein